MISGLTSCTFGECQKGQGDNIAPKIEYHVEEAATEDSVEEDKQVEDTEIASEEQVEETKPQPNYFRTVVD